MVAGASNNWHRSLHESPQTTSQKISTTKTRKRQTGSTSSSGYEAQLKQLLGALAPDKLANAPMLLQKWEGREAELLAKIKDKYGCAGC